MNWQLLRNRLVNQPEYHERPQQVVLIDHSLRLIREGVENLARLGHQLHLAEGPQPPEASKPWPRMMYNLAAAPRGHLVFCAEDLAFLGEGWFDTLDEAKHADGMGHQFRRGGIFPKRALPAIPIDFKPSPIDSERFRSNIREKEGSDGSR